MREGGWKIMQYRSAIVVIRHFVAFDNRETTDSSQTIILIIMGGRRRTIHVLLPTRVAFNDNQSNRGTLCSPRARPTLINLN